MTGLAACMYRTYAANTAISDGDSDGLALVCSLDLPAANGVA